MSKVFLPEPTSERGSGRLQCLDNESDSDTVGLVRRLDEEKPCAKLQKTPSILNTNEDTCNEWIFASALISSLLWRVNESIHSSGITARMACHWRLRLEGSLMCIRRNADRLPIT